MGTASPSVEQRGGRDRQIDRMAEGVLQRQLAINMACVKEFPNQSSRKRQASGKAEASGAQGPKRTARDRLTELGHDIEVQRTTLKCTRCCCSRPTKEAQKWVKEGVCQGPPAPSTGDTTAPRPPTERVQAPQRFGRGLVHPTHRTTLIKGLLFCWGCGGFSVTKVRALAKPCAPLKSKRVRLARVRSGLPPTRAVQWPVP